MAVDPLSPIAPARIRALLLPVGRIKRSRFLAFVELLQQQSLVRLGDISPDSRPDRNMFSPLAFPAGTLLYDLTTSLPPPSHLALSPFEQFREPLLVIGVGDASQRSRSVQSRASDGVENGLPKGDPTNGTDYDDSELDVLVEDLKEKFPRAYLHNVLMFEAEVHKSSASTPDIIFVPPASNLKTTTMKTIMCDITASLLAEMTTLARSIQALPSVPSPASQTGGAGSTPSWAGSDMSTALPSRRNSQTPSVSRPESPLSGAQKDTHRMSMPVLPSSAGGPVQVEDPRAASPSTQGTRTPPTTFDEISGVNATNSPDRNVNKGNAATKDSSSDRVSISGFGSGGVGERARNKGRGRISIVTGTLYLCAGQWQDAIRELTEGVTRARAFSDHLWHAKGLENIMVCLLLFAWSGLEFQIPQICFPISDKATNLRSPQHTPSTSAADVTASKRGPSHEAALERLNSLLPDLINMILNLYNRASNFSGESLPPVAFSECVIRFSKLLAAVNLSAGYMDDDTLEHLVRNTPHRQKPRLSVPRLSVHPTRNDVASLLFRALPGPVESAGLGPSDRVVILAGIASVLSALGLQRKKAIIMKDFITSIIPGLVQARKVGAAEMGVHPAAGLAALNLATGSTSGAGALSPGGGESESGINEFLSLLSRIYGIPVSKQNSLNAVVPASSMKAVKQVTDQTNPRHAIADIIRISSLRAFGSVGVKLDVLRLCLNFCEALPDFDGVLHFTALLLRMAGPGTAPRPNSTDVFVSLPRDEQVRLYSNFSRTVGAANKLGLQHNDTEYWDDFLVRGLFILDEPVPLRLTRHLPTELKSTSTGKGPFLHNPWLKAPQSNNIETVLVANEDYRFVIALQNPYDFELSVDSLRIAAEGVEFAAREENFLLGPYRTQKFQIVGVPKASGTLKITGCYIKIIGCRERLFPIFPDPWKPTRESKMKHIGLRACIDAPASRPSSAVAPLVDRITGSEPKPDFLSFEVIPDQPTLVVIDVSLSQSSIMVLEGEKKRFTVTVRNTSSTVVVDFVHITFQDSASTTIKSSATAKDISPAELHELETQLAHYPSLHWCKDSEDEAHILQPGATSHFTIEVTGRPRLTDAIIQIDYANLGKRRSEVQDRFFTRQVSVPISITVNASVQLQKPDILSYSHGTSGGVDTGEKQSRVSLGQLSSLSALEDSCFLLLDLRNAWPNPLVISIALSPSSTSDQERIAEKAAPHTVSEVIQPGHVSRVAMLVPKLFLSHAHSAIPSLNPANQRQFVVSASKISPETERASREAFWYRNALLAMLSGTWAEESTGRHGVLELRGMRFSPRMIDAIKLDDLKIEMNVSPESQDAGDVGHVQYLGQMGYQVPVDYNVTLNTRILNRSTRPISPLLRLQPHLANMSHNVALDLDKRLSWTGALQARLPVLQPGDEQEYELGCIALCSGTFEISASVDEVELAALNTADGARQRSDTQSILQGDIIGEPKLRSWHTKQPCTIVARR